VHLRCHGTGSKPASIYMYALLDTLLLISKTRDTRVRMSGESSSGKGFGIGRKEGTSNCLGGISWA
jgi:hypothetical protein